MTAQPQGKDPTSSSSAAQTKPPLCGVIMPISETATHSEQHWKAVQTLLHRAISNSGFEPRNVWESTATDRISERIIGNIFQVPILVADITDLNPNVMLELGLRLASKKPTVVIATNGSIIPFDIRDFHAVFYPSDMNMLAMEDFFRVLSKILKDKHKSLLDDKYTPFLGNVIVDVVSPETREVSLNEAILSRLEQISTRLNSVETLARIERTSSLVRSRKAELHSGMFSFEIPDENAETFSSYALRLIEVDRISHKPSLDGDTLIEIHYSGADNATSLHKELIEMAVRLGGGAEIPF